MWIDCIMPFLFCTQSEAIFSYVCFEFQLNCLVESSLVELSSYGVGFKKLIGREWPTEDVLIKRRD